MSLRMEFQRTNKKNIRARRKEERRIAKETASFEKMEGELLNKRRRLTLMIYEVDMQLALIRNENDKEEE